MGGSPTYICIWLITKTIPSEATMTCMGCILSDHPVEATRHMLMSDPSLVMACHCHFSTPDHDARSPTALRHATVIFLNRRVSPTRHLGSCNLDCRSFRHAPRIICKSKDRVNHLKYSTDLKNRSIPLLSYRWRRGNCAGRSSCTGPRSNGPRG